MIKILTRKGKIILDFALRFILFGRKYMAGLRKIVSSKQGFKTTH